MYSQKTPTKKNVIGLTYYNHFPKDLLRPYGQSYGRTWQRRHETQTIKYQSLSAQPMLADIYLLNRKELYEMSPLNTRQSSWERWTL